MFVNKEKQLQKQVSKISGKWLTMVGVGIGVFIFALDVYIVNLCFTHYN